MRSQPNRACRRATGCTSCMRCAARTGRAPRCGRGDRLRPRRQDQPARGARAGTHRFALLRRADDDVRALVATRGAGRRPGDSRCAAGGACGDRRARRRLKAYDEAWRAEGSRPREARRRGRCASGRCGRPETQAYAICGSRCSNAGPCWTTHGTRLPGDVRAVAGAIEEMIESSPAPPRTRGTGRRQLGRDPPRPRARTGRAAPAAAARLREPDARGPPACRGRRRVATLPAPARLRAQRAARRGSTRADPSLKRRPGAPGAANERLCQVPFRHVLSKAFIGSPDQPGLVRVSVRLRLARRDRDGDLLSRAQHRQLRRDADALVGEGRCRSSMLPIACWS